MNHPFPRLLAGFVTLCSLATWLSCDCLCKTEQRPVDNTESHAAARPSPIEPGKPWSFVVSGDSRNCGDVIMPAIAHSAEQSGAKFYWHLGDLRAIYDFDEDMQAEWRARKQKLDILKYLKQAWDDFDKHQIGPFGRIPFVIGIGNHETIPEKDRCQFAERFASWLKDPMLEHPPAASPAAAIKPASAAGATTGGKCPDKCDEVQPTTYYRWILDGKVDFIYLDNASECQFSDAQLQWFDKIVDQDLANTNLRSLVVGMHAALPESLSRDHSMNEWRDKEWQRGIETGTRVYRKLLDARKSKNVYVLASHSHYFMEDIFNTQHWRSNGGVLQGWIIGTAGAQRYPLPEHPTAKQAKTDVYGYLLGTVDPSGTVSFAFKEIAEDNIPGYVKKRYTPEFVHWCYAHNRKGDDTLPLCPACR